MNTDEELFLRALESMDRGDIFGGKYGPPIEEVKADKKKGKEGQAGENDYIEFVDPGTAKKKSKKEAKSPNPTKNKAVYDAPEFSQEVYEEDQFEVTRDDFLHLMRYELDKITLHDNSKYYEQQHSHPVFQYEENPIERTIETEPLPTDPDGLRNVRLMLQQGRLLERYAKEDLDYCSEINLRKLSLKQALDELIDEVEYAYRKGIRFLRVITGKGINSSDKDGPKIKKGVIEWVEQNGYVMVRGCAPQVSADGDYGAIILEIRERPRF